MPTPPRPTCLFVLTCLALTVRTLAADAVVPSPRPWEPDAFLPVTEARIAALPAGEQPGWRAYWQASVERSHLLPERDLVDHSSTKPLAGPPIGSSYSKGVKLGAPAAWYATEEARTIADKVVKWQRPTGGWVKSGDYSRDPEAKDDHHDAWSNGTFDNDSTIYELRFLALVAQAAGADPRAQAWRDSFLRGLDYIFAAQYPNGGFPQIYPLVGWYHDAITFNDDAMVHILELCRDIAGRQAEFAFVPAANAERARQAEARGIQCVLATQLRAPDGHRTIWGQQHDPLTLKPCAARNFEPISECSLESAGLTQFLMTVPAPGPEIVGAIDSAMAWFPAHALHGVVWDRDVATGNALVPRAGAPELWARYYEIGTGRPVFGERDRMVHYNVTELSLERRKGYGWFNSRATALPAAYAKWKAQLAAK
ncbi:MAG: pectate lyase [Lacunisphaera sp.]|nr:pectate lyase [Lacunisphaera sp.]MDB6165373.1 pectate lyase [Lacunisphaera sp.]